MSNYWAGYSGIGMMLSETELEDFIEKYRKLRSAELEEYCKHLTYVPDYDDDDECEKRDFIDMILDKEGGFALSDAFAEGFSFFPYVYEGNPNTEYQDTSADLSTENSYILTADYNNNGVEAFFSNKKYHSYEELVDEFKRKYAEYLPEDFDWDSHIGQYSYACYA